MVFICGITDKKDSASSVGVGDLEITPVSAAIARHLGIDLTPEGKAARNRRGIAVIVHGTPQSGNNNDEECKVKVSSEGVLHEKISCTFGIHILT